MARHYSPPGTFEAIRKEILEDPTWTPAAFRVAMWLAAKPDGWVLHVKPIADGTGLKSSTVQAGIRELRRRGLVYDEQVRSEGSRRIDGWETRFRRDLVVAAMSTPPENEGVDVTSQNAVDVSTPPENRGVDVTSQNAVSTPPENRGVDVSTPPENRGVEDMLQTPRSQPCETHNPSSGQPPDFSLPLQKIGPNREDGLGLKDLRDNPPTDIAIAARQERAQPTGRQSTLDDTNPALNGSTGNGSNEGKQLRPTQRAKKITDAYAERIPLCKWPAVNGVVLKAIKTGLYGDQQIHEAIQRLADENRAVTVDALRYEIEGFPASRQTSRQRRPSTSAAIHLPADDLQDQSIYD